MNSSNLTSDHAAVLVAVTARYLDFVRRLTARMREAHFPLEDSLTEATRLFLPHVEAHAKFLHDLHRWIVSVEEIERERGQKVWPVVRRERYRHIPPTKDGDVF